MSTPQSSAPQRPVCPNCGWVNRVGALICERCLNTLVEIDAPTSSPQDEPSLKSRTAVLGDEAPPRAVEEQKEDTGIQLGSDVFGADMVLRLEVMNAGDELVVDPHREIVIGRRDPATGTAPDVDLTAFSGYKLGVSRKHAVLRVRGGRLEILDLGSSNGTMVNGVRIPSHEPRLLRDGDQLLMGKLSMRISFQAKEQP
jgi:hypothetical protein